MYPWILNFCNNITNDDQLRGVQFPDVNTASLPHNSRFSMSAGDFLQVYNEPSLWIFIEI
jgi:carnosine N-methyltransferase